MPKYLYNEILNVEIGEPGELYSGSRFDHSGNIAQVTLNNQHTFCSTEKPVLNPIYGFGLMNEFDIGCPESFKETRTGSHFLKIGVGEIMRDDDQPYNFYKLYPFEQAKYTVDVEGNTRIQFKTESNPVNGFQIEYTKIISIEGRMLTIDYLLKNCGEKSFSTEEYCHNFLSIDHQVLSEDYRLDFNFDFEPEKFEVVVDLNSDMIIGKHSISWNKTPVGDIFIGELCPKTPFRAEWKLVNTRSKVGMSETVSFESTKVNMWGNGHVVSPELFFQTKLNPGEEARWQRRYTFFEI